MILDRMNMQEHKMALDPVDAVIPAKLVCL
jgi:hypothetical protein